MGNRFYLLSIAACMQVIYAENVRLVHEAHEHLLHKIYERYFTRLLPRGREGLLWFGREMLYPPRNETFHLRTWTESATQHCGSNEVGGEISCARPWTTPPDSLSAFLPSSAVNELPSEPFVCLIPPPSLPNGPLKRIARSLSRGERARRPRGFLASAEKSYGGKTSAEWWRGL